MDKKQPKIFPDASPAQHAKALVVCILPDGSMLLGEFNPDYIEKQGPGLDVNPGRLVVHWPVIRKEVSGIVPMAVPGPVGPDGRPPMAPAPTVHPIFFLLPVEQFNLNVNNVPGHGIVTDEEDTLYKQYYQFLGDYRAAAAKTISRIIP